MNKDEIANFFGVAADAIPETDSISVPDKTPVMLEVVSITHRSKNDKESISIGTRILEPAAHKGKTLWANYSLSDAAYAITVKALVILMWETGVIGNDLKLVSGITSEPVGLARAIGQTIKTSIQVRQSEGYESQTSFGICWAIRDKEYVYDSKPNAARRLEGDSVIHELYKALDNNTIQAILGDRYETLPSGLTVGGTVRNPKMGKTINGTPQFSCIIELMDDYEGRTMNFSVPVTEKNIFVLKSLMNSTGAKDSAGTNGKTVMFVTNSTERFSGVSYEMGFYPYSEDTVVDEIPGLDRDELEGVDDEI